MGVWHKFRQIQSDDGLWHFVDLPKEDKNILVTYVSYGRKFVDIDVLFHDDSGYYLDSGYKIGLEAIAWMSLPEPYEEADE